MAGFAIPPIRLSEEAMDLFRRHTEALEAMTAELKRYNDGPTDVIAEKPPEPELKVSTYLGITRVEFGDQVVFHDPVKDEDGPRPIEMGTFLRGGKFRTQVTGRREEYGTD